MCSRGAAGGAVRQLALYLRVHIRRSGSVPSLAVTLCAVVLLCALEPCEATSAVQRTQVRRQTHAENEDAILFPSQSPPSAPHLIATGRSNPQQKRVKCFYFKTRPLRTYCHVLGLEGVITAQDAENECLSISMDIISLNTTPMHRLCTLMKYFGLEEHKLWLADVLDNSQPLTWDECNVEVLTANVTKPPTNCPICNIAVVCDAGFYHSSGSNCVVMEHGSEDVEYCYHDDKATARESHNRCLKQPSQSSLIMDMRLLQDYEVGYVRGLIRTDLEFWVDLKREDVSEVSGVVAFEADAIDWDTSCFTVWFGRDVPWFFNRSCDERYPVVCEDSAKTGSATNYPLSDCIYHRTHSWMFDYCVPEGRTFNMTAGAEFCDNHSMSLLKGKTLHELFFVYTRKGSQPSGVNDDFIIWDARAGSTWYHLPHNVCPAVSLKGSPLVPVTRNCSDKLGYICRRTRSPEMHGFNCESVSRSENNRPPTCVTHSNLTFEESVKACNAVGMSLLPDGLDVQTYESLLKGYDTYGYRKENTVFWLHSPKRTLSAGKSCSALVRNQRTFILSGMDCSTKLRSLCVFAKISDITKFPPTTDATVTFPPGQTTTAKVAISNTGAWPTKCLSMEGWPMTKVGQKATKPCGGNSTGDILRMCGEDGIWSKDKDLSHCTSPQPPVIEKAVKESKNITEVAILLGDMKGHVGVAGDIRIVSSTLSTVIARLDVLLNNTSEEEWASQTRHLATTVVDLASATMKKPHIWNVIPESERLDTAAGLARKVEDIVIRMIMHQYPILTETTFGSENITMAVKPVTEESIKNVTVLSAATGATVKLPPGYLSGKLENAAIIFSENTLVHDIFKASSSPKSTKYPILATSFLTVSLLSNGARTSKINGSVTLSFKNNNALKELTPKCSFIKVNDNGDNGWSTEGCTLVTISDNEIVCSCDHLTVFAVLMSRSDIVDKDDILRLEWITKIGCGISIVCLAACIVIFTVYRQLKGIRNTIHRNLCLSLLIAEVILLAGMQRVPVHHEVTEPSEPIVQVPVSCTVVAFLLHFFFLAAFGWMALEGCHIIVLLWKVFNQKRTYYERYYFAGYGIPLIISGVTLGSRYDLYANRKADDIFCWLPEEKGVRYSFIGPVAAVILLNLGALCLVLWKMSHVRLVVEKSTAEKVKNWVRGTFILLPILGVTWLFGFLMLGDKDLHRVGAYLFTIFNSLQGLGIFVCHVFMSKKTREAIFRSVISTGSILKGSMSSRPSGSGTSSTKTTWYPISSLSSNSTSHSSSSSNGIPSNDAEQPSQSFHTEATSWTPLQWLPGTRFRYNLRLNQGDPRTPRSRAQHGSGDQEGRPTVAKFRWTRSIAA